jgi:hypothetical protein
VNQAATAPVLDEFCCAPEVAWVRDADRVLVLEPATGRSWSLRGIEAALWDWLAIGYPYAKLVHLMSLALDSPRGAAEEQALELLHRWHDEGILQRKGRPTP